MLIERVAYSVREAARSTSYSEELIRKAIREGVLKASRPGGIGDLRILREDLVHWLRGADQPVKPRKQGTRLRSRNAVAG